MILALGLWAPATALAAEPTAAPTSTAEPEPEPMPVTAGDRPTRAPVHADCNHRMPLYLHEVEPGEHLGLIAGRYGVRRTELAALNPQLTNPDLIRPGETVRVCPEIFPRLTRRIEHVVAKGETLSAIATLHGLSVDDLVEQQSGGIADPNVVRVGQRLLLEVDGGLVPDFLPPEPKAKRRRRRSGGKSRAVSMALPTSKLMHIKRPGLAYGTPKTISLLQRAVKRYKGRHASSPRVLVGDISRKGGGRLDPHASHRTGRDVDMGYVLLGSHAKRTRFSGVNRDTLDVAKTWALLDAFLETGEVVFLFVDYRIQQQLYDYAKQRGVSQHRLDEVFQYPHGRRRARGIIRHWPSHRNHFHVRFRT
ncbi:MAG: penicillin-insensitive murein endopeptidase [Deltaproteobacteria bacterium]|nr:penicillin-insensitive murein endopeptidase [Deltaproteobacteria bacterium]